MSTEQALKNSHIYSGYAFIFEGFFFMLFPHLAAKLLFLPTPSTAQAEQYARIMGLAISVIGYYYCLAGKHSIIQFFRASIIGRLSILPIITFLIYFW